MPQPVPSRVVFTGEKCRDAYRLNKFLVSMRDAENRAAFQRDPEQHMAASGLSEHERDLVRRRDYQGMLDHGCVIYAVGKASTAFGTSLLGIGAQMRGESVETVTSWIAAAQNVRR